MTLPASAARARAADVDGYLLHAPELSSKPAAGRTDGQTDGHWTVT